MSSNHIYHKQEKKSPTRRDRVLVIDAAARKDRKANPDAHSELYLRRNIKLFALLFIGMIGTLVLSIKFVEYQWSKGDRRIAQTYQSPQREAPAVLSSAPLMPPTALQPSSAAPPAPVPAPPDRAAEIDTILRWGAVLEEAGELEGALDRYDEVIRLQPENVGALARAGRLNIRMGRYAEAVDVLTDARGLAGDDPDILNDLGVALTFNHQAAEAVALYDALLASHPHYTPALFNQGYALVQAGDNDRARPLLERYIETNPGDGMALGVLAMLEVAAGNTGRAVELLDQAIAAKPDWSTPYLDAATICAGAGESTRALQYLESALAIAPPSDVYQRYLTAPFNDIRITEEGKAFEKKIADLARKMMGR